METVHETVLKVHDSHNEVHEPRSCFVARLPNEVLDHIFVLTMLSSFAHCDLSRTSDFLGLYRWVTITEVCRHWYNTAIHNPALWSRVYVPSDLTGMNVMPRRSQDAPLYIVYRSDWKLPSKMFMQLVLKDHWHRIQTLFLYLIHGTLFQDTEFYKIVIDFTRQAPILHTLDVWRYSEDVPDIYFSSQNMPSLRVFRAWRTFWVPWENLSSMSNLQVLILFTPPDPAQVTPMSTFIDTLLGLKHLRELQLRLDFSATAGDNLPTVPLSSKNLERLHLSTSPVACSIPLQLITTALNLNLSLDVLDEYYHTTTNAERSLLMSSIIPKFSGSTSPFLLHRFTITFMKNPHRWQITNVGLALQGTMDASKTFQLIMPSAQPLDDLRTDFLNLLPLHSVRQLYIDLSIFKVSTLLVFKPVDFAMLSDKSPSLDTLILRGWPSTSCIEVLCNPHAEVSGCGVPWPSLTTLMLKRIRSPSKGGDGDAEFVRPLRDGLLGRQARGCAKLDHLYVSLRGSIMKKLDFSILQECCRELVIVGYNDTEWGITYGMVHAHGHVVTALGYRYLCSTKPARSLSLVRLVGTTTAKDGFGVPPPPLDTPPQISDVQR
ncbi:hypothetical protein NM688_g8689 [Phlebia brevispora]|uniref:Uncharacterized protein n=1 Tax=Phlebia brevispora TaxID=194682 RepID=A0ACC1RQS6_9APHY|nr:hypothetical protein NM688_g8689 [Phlebia brevispora]